MIKIIHKKSDLSSPFPTGMLKYVLNHGSYVHGKWSVLWTWGFLTFWNHCFDLHLWEWETYLNLRKRPRKKQGRDKVIQKIKNTQPPPNTHLLQGAISYSPVLRALPLSYLAKVSQSRHHWLHSFGTYVNDVEIRSGKPKKDIKSRDIYIPDPCMYLFQERNNKKKMDMKKK